MSWPIPPAGAIAEQFALGFERAFRLDPRTGLPRAETVDARSPSSPLRVIGVSAELTWTELYLYQRSLASELFPDTAVDELPRHAAEWGVQRLQPLPSVGFVTFTASAGLATPLAIPAGVVLAGDGGRLYATTAATMVTAGSSAIVGAEAAAPGPEYDLAPGAVLQLASPLAGLSVQTVTSAAGFAGGRLLEGTESWRARILRRIRERGRAGARKDYEAWAEEAGAAYWAVLPRWVGAGSVGVAVAMAGPRVPTTAEAVRINGYIQDVRPVTAEVVVVPATLLPVDVSLRLTPDTVAVRAAVVAALQAFLLRDGQIGGVLSRSRMAEAISGAAGEYSHVLVQPAADVAPAPTQLPVLGTVTFGAG